jgi:sugar lactone lactonase YvrE
MRNWLNRVFKPQPRAAGGRRKPSPRLAVESLETRLVPAFNLTIGTGATAGVAHDSAGHFTANAHGAAIAVSDILADLRAGKSVNISDGSTGSEAGNINWLSGNDLGYSGIGAGGLGLTISTDRSATGGSVALNSHVYDSGTSPTDSLAVTVSARGSLQVNASILAGAAPISLAADVNSDGSAGPGGGVLSIGPGVGVRGSAVTLRGDDVLIDTSGNPATVTATGGSQSYLATPLNGPGAVAVDTQGNVYVGNSTGGTVLKVTPAGAITTFATGFSTVSGLVFGPGGSLFVSDSSRGTVSKVSSAGVATVFASGLSGPNAMTFDSHGNLFVANSGNNKVVEITPAGVVSTLPYTFSGPLGLAFDKNGNLYVANTFSGTVSKVAAGGGVSTYLTGLYGPQSLAFDAQGNLYVANTGYSIVLKVTPGGTRSNFLQGTSGGGALAFDAQGNLYVTEIYANDVRKVTPAGVASVFLNDAKYDPQGIAFDAAGNLFFASPISNTVSKLTPAGVLTTYTGFVVPSTVAIDSRGNVYVANYGNGTVSKITPAGVVSLFALGFANPSGLAFDAQGNLFVANFGNGSISEVTPDGAVSTSVGGFQGPTGLAFDSAGNLYIADETANTVYKFIPGSAVIPFLSGLNKPVGLALDTHGSLYVANFGVNTVLEVGPNASVLATFAGFNGPYGLAFDANGNLLVANNATTSFTLLNVGSVTVRSSLASRPIKVGGAPGAVAGINLTAAELGRFIAPGSITVGDSTQTGTITFTNAPFNTESVQVVESPTGPGRIVLDEARTGFALLDLGGTVILSAGTGGIQEINAASLTSAVIATRLELTTPGSVGSLVQPLVVSVPELGTGAVGGSLFLTDNAALTTGGPLTLGVSAYLTLLDNFFAHAGDIVARAINLTFNGYHDEEFDAGGLVFSNVMHKGTGTLQLVGDGLTVKGNVTNAPDAGNFDANDLPVTVTGLTTIDGGIYLAGAGTQVFSGGLVVNAAFDGGTGTVTTGGVTISLYGTFIAPSTTLFDTGNWVNAGGVFDANGGTVVFNGTSLQTINAGWQDFNNVTHSGIALLRAVQSDLTVDGLFTNAAGAGAFDPNGWSFTVLGIGF